MATKKGAVGGGAGVVFFDAPPKTAPWSLKIIISYSPADTFSIPHSIGRLAQTSLAPARYPPRRPKGCAAVAWVGNSNTCQIFCIRLSAALLLHSRKPITQLLRFIRPAT